MSLSRSLGSNGECCFWPSAFTAAGTNCGRSVPLCGALHPSEKLQVRLRRNGRMGRDCLRCAPAVCLWAIFGWRLRFALLDLSDCSNCVLHPSEKLQVRLRRNGGWGGIGLALLDLSNGSNCVLHPSEKLQVRLTAKWRMGRDSNPRCIAAHTLSKRAHSTTLPPILEQEELNTTVGRAARR